ncbi:MAG TPA: hypothetical protein VF795_11630 [Desulfuromonadaceae bacterium]
MAEKGARARLEPVGKMLYCDGKSKVAIAEILEVSRQTVDDWCEWGGWDKAKAAKDSYEADLVYVRNELMAKIKEAPIQAGSYTPALTQISSLIDRREKAVRESIEAIKRQQGEMFLNIVQDLVGYAQENAPELAEVIEQHFEGIIKYGREKYAA